MHHAPLLTNIAVALAAALVGGVVARRVGVPAIVGYLVAGVAIGPGTPGFVGDSEAIAQLAELGIALLMFGVGAHFSVRDLWCVRRIAVPGALLQMIASTALGFALARAWGWSVPASLLLGIAISIASTIVLVRALVDAGLLDTQAGRVAVGWLVLEDIATVLALVLLPVTMGAERANGLEVMAIAIGKAALFVVLMTIAGVRLVPWVLSRIARTHSRELFVVAALTVAVGTALASAELFGVSIALGAFVAGVVVRQSRYGHQVSADLVPFRDAFSVLFFVSIGMLLDLDYVRRHAIEIVVLTSVVIAGKALLAAGLVLVIARSLRTALVVAAGLAQIGEFSFIVGQAGVTLGVLEGEQYSLILAVAVLSIALNPLAFRVAESLSRRTPAMARAPLRAESEETLRDHVVVVGLGRVGRHVVEVLDAMQIPTLVIDQDESRLRTRGSRSARALFGDAASPEILAHASLHRARAMIVAVPDSGATELVVDRAREMAPSLPIIARAPSPADCDALAEAGATEAVDPQLEGAMEILRRALLLLGVSVGDVHQSTESARARHGGRARGDRRVLDQLVRGTRDLELRWIRIEHGGASVGATLGETELRARTGASCIAIARGETLRTNPDASTRIRPGDDVAVIGTPEQIEAAQRWLTRAERETSSPARSLAGEPPS